jgi:hypothetical protein
VRYVEAIEHIDVCIDDRYGLPERRIIKNRTQAWAELGRKPCFVIVDCFAVDEYESPYCIDLVRPIQRDRLEAISAPRLDAPSKVVFANFFSGLW